MTRRGPTSRDVARLAGVSQATVSAVINQSHYVSPELVARVEEAIRELGYRPNRAARALKTGKTGVLGLVVPNILSPHWSAVVRSVSRTVAERGLALLLCESDEDDVTERTSLLMLVERQVDGILLGTRGVNRELIAGLVSQHVPLVLVDSGVDGLDVDAVTINDEQGAFLATDHLLAHGRRRIGLVNILPASRFGARNRLAGYRRALESHGLTYDPALVRHAGFFEPDGYGAARELLALPKPPDALFIANHLMTIGALHAAAEAGVRVSEDLAVIGFDDTPWAPWTAPALSLIAQPREELGVRVVQLLLRRMKEPEAPPRKHVLSTRLVLRRSCGCPYVPELAPAETAVQGKGMTSPRG
jgi:LacI family transcriptional regulator